MRHRAVIAGVLGVALGVAAYLIDRRAPIAGSVDRAEPSDSPLAQIPSDIPEPSSSATGDVAIQHAADEVRALSQTFRNGTFLIAIRRAGYYCEDVVSASESADGGWVATCASKGGYALSVRAIDQFDVRPIGHYLDGIAPVPISRDE